jgi:hypothetical protein
VSELRFSRRPLFFMVPFEAIGMKYGRRPKSRTFMQLSILPVRAISGTEEPFTGSGVRNRLAIEQHLGEG